MNNWKTELVVTPNGVSIELSDRILTIGSCFSESIGSRLSENKFNVFNNPFGTTYHPLAIHHLLKLAVSNGKASEDDYLVREEIHYHYQFHSSFAGLSQQELAHRIRHSIETVCEWIHKTQYLLITYGTAWIYKRKDNEQWVANCHKVPTDLFSKELISVESMEDSFNKIFAILQAINPAIKVIVTISPVRHIKDTLELNSVSKSSLRLLCYRLAQRDNVEYFPAFELMMDDLRDYRFYQKDRIHPTLEAEEYIWEKFSQKYFSVKTRALLKQWKEIKSALNHRPAFPSTAHHQSFLKATLKKLEALQPHIDVSNEATLLSKQIAKL